MSACPFGRCDGSGEVVRFVQYVGGEAIEREPCPCAKRDTIPTPREQRDDERCAAWGCHGCPACIDGLVP